MTAITRQRPLIQANDKFDDIKIRTVLNETRTGRTNNGGQFSFAMNATQTTVSDDIVTTNSVILLEAESAVARAVHHNIPRATILAGSFLVQHDSTSVSTCSFCYTVNC